MYHNLKEFPFDVIFYLLPVGWESHIDEPSRFMQKSDVMSQLQVSDAIYSPRSMRLEPRWNGELRVFLFAQPDHKTERGGRFRVRYRPG